MAATALDVLSLERLKHELRIDPTETSQDSTLIGQIQASVSHVAQSVTVPLLDRTETLYVRQSPSDRPAFLRATYVKQVSAVRYWTPDGALRLPANASIALADLGRQQPSFTNSAGLRLGEALGLWVWPPADGWPPVLSGSCFEFDILRGLDIGPEEEALVQAVILCCRQLYDGREEIRPTTAYKQFIKPWKSMSP